MSEPIPPVTESGRPAREEPAAATPDLEVPPELVRGAVRSRGEAAGAGGYAVLPAAALFVGGFLTCLGLVLSLLALNGTIRPASPAAAASASASAVAAASPPASGSPGASPSGSAAPSLPPIVAPTVVTPVALADGRALGPKTAPVTVEVWEDFQCPYCRRFTEQVEPRIVSTYVATGKVRFVYRDYAFLGEESLWAEVAARLADQQGKFWPYHDYLFANQAGENNGSFSLDRLREMARAVGLDMTKFDAGVEVSAANALLQQVEPTEKADAEKLGIGSTPTVTVAGTALKGNDWATIQAAIDKALAAKP